MLNPDWRTLAACLNHPKAQELFFPADGKTISDQARSICHGCPSIIDCLDYAVVNVERFGLWGGIGEHERRVLRRVRPLGHRFTAGCACPYCTGLLVATFPDQPELVLVNRNGTAAKCGHLATYARGCRCNGCSQRSAYVDRRRHATKADHQTPAFKFTPTPQPLEECDTHGYAACPLCDYATSYTDTLEPVAA